MRHLNFYYFNAKVNLNGPYIGVSGKLFWTETSMKTRHIIILKFVGLVATVAYGWSMLWISLMFIYGWIYKPINDSSMKSYLPFNAIVILITLIAGVMLFRQKSGTILKILAQDLGLIAISFPFFATALGIFNIGFDDTNNPRLIFVVITFLTLVTINLNDMVKLKKASR